MVGVGDGQAQQDGQRFGHQARDRAQVVDALPALRDKVRQGGPVVAQVVRQQRRAAHDGAQGDRGERARRRHPRARAATDREQRPRVGQAEWQQILGHERLDPCAEPGHEPHHQRDAEGHGARVGMARLQDQQERAQQHDLAVAEAGDVAVVQQRAGAKRDDDGGDRGDTAPVEGRAERVDGAHEEDRAGQHREA